MMENIKLFITNKGEDDLDYQKNGIVARLLKVADESICPRLIVLAENKVMEIPYEDRDIREATEKDENPYIHTTKISCSGKFVLEVNAYRTSRFIVRNIETQKVVREVDEDFNALCTGWHGELEYWCEELEKIDFMED